MGVRGGQKRRRNEWYIPTEDEIFSLRTAVPDDEAYSDDEIRDALIAAKEWINGMRYSTIIVAKYVLIDGYPHA